MNSLLLKEKQKQAKKYFLILAIPSVIICLQKTNENDELIDYRFLSKLMVNFIVFPNQYNLLCPLIIEETIFNDQNNLRIPLFSKKHHSTREFYGFNEVALYLF